MAEPKKPAEVSPEERLLLQVEALLFAAGKPVTVHELVERLGLRDHRPVQKAIQRLSHNYGSRRTALELRRAGEGYSLQVRSEYLPVAHQVAPTEIPLRTLRVLALIAYHQPIRQSLLVKMIGDQAYEEVQALRGTDFIRASPRGGTLLLTTTPRFAEHFGLETTEKGKIKELLERRLGIAPVETLPATEPAPEESEGEKTGDPGNEEVATGPSKEDPVPRVAG
jgi:segregation and condensation protein B